ncbi:RDD family protein [Alteraurantiacibacter buctensis]|uniref:RDD family protein n=1 Tax=Alteraurantiacibacter buctensis TaxID=1503981 RepID=A0A844Z504_9SPHN|nr:RDD family protein [Alteraurantiacibacter buctensis]MXO72913.1 RDD family protein [Alteraurantiacibacter buctensis]
MTNYAGFWRRVGAYLIDVILLGIVTSILGSVLGLPMGTEAMSAMMSGDPAAIAAAQSSGNTGNLISILIGVAYFAGMESSSHQATLGKKVLGMVVTDVNGNRLSLGRAIGRYFAKFVSAIILGIGFIMVAFTEKKQGLHDMIAGTLVHVGQPTVGNAQTFS